MSKAAPSPGVVAALTLGALGVVYGDIGTSPLYALKEVFHAGHVPLSRENVLGVLSLIFWTITVVVSLKYVLLILRADNNGEGGLIAMLALATTAVKDRPPLRRLLMVVGLFGTAIFYGDGVITPAISVLSAVEGLKLATPAFEPYVVPLSVAILVALFLVQARGTARVAQFFGPVMVVWFFILALGGILHLIDDPRVFLAINPYYAISFMARHGLLGFTVLGFILLAVTGAEALYVDLGHFGRKPIQIAWFGLVLPALALNYLGQGAFVIANLDRYTFGIDKYRVC